MHKPVPAPRYGFSMSRSRRVAVVLLVLVTVAVPATIALSSSGHGGTSASKRLGTPKTIVGGLDIPWGIAFLPDGSALISERGSNKILKRPPGGGKLRPVMTLPGVDTNAGEGGLLGLAVSPRYKRDRYAFAYYTSTQGDNRIVRFRLGGKVDPILTGIESSSIHNGGRITFGPDGNLYAGVGDAADTDNSQDRTSLNGKILRMRPDGSAPRGNPFGDSLVWSYGHRNVQGLAFDRQGRLWASEFGQSNVDEVNLIRPGGNYGWPVVEGRGDTQSGKFTNPKVTWSPTSTSSPSGALIRGNTLYVAALAGERLWKIPLNGTNAGKPKALYSGRFGRLRTVVSAPDGSIWLATATGPGDRIIRIPAGG